MTERDVLSEPWACLTCSKKMQAGELRSGGDKPYLHCPFCGSPDLHAIEREPVTVPEYHGEIGTRN